MGGSHIVVKKGLYSGKKGVASGKVTHKKMLKGGTFREAGVDSVIQKHLTKSRNGGQILGGRGRFWKHTGSTPGYHLESTQR